MAYDDWPEEIQEVYLNAIAFTWLAPEYGAYGTGATEDDIQTAEELFEAGWIDMVPGGAQEPRDLFYAYTDTSSADVDWGAWKDFWGY